MKLKRPVLIGDLHNEISQKMVKTFLVQNEREISDGIKGFILHGPPGTGRAGYGLCRRSVEGQMAARETQYSPVIGC